MADYFERRENEVRPRLPQTPRSARFLLPWDDDELPIIDSTESFSGVVTKLVAHIHRTVDAAYSYEQLRTFAGQSLRPLVIRLSEDCHHPAVVAALLAAKYVFRATDDEGTGLSESRGLACEIVAYQFLTFLTHPEIIDYLLFEVPDLSAKRPTRSVPNRPTVPHVQLNVIPGENTPLIQRRSSSQTRQDGSGTANPLQPIPPVSLTIPVGGLNDNDVANDAAHDNTLKSLVGMNTLEIAGIARAKAFISQRTVQKIVDDIWNGDVIFWESLSVEAVRRPRTYNKKIADPFTRLRVPQYQKAFQVGFFVSFLVLFYVVLVGRTTQRITPAEALLYWWIAAFAYDELGEIQDTGILFYRVDFWSLWDVGIISASFAFVATRIYGIVRNNGLVTSVAFDILSMVALFLVPRTFSVVSLNPYFGSLIPVLKEMTKTFCMFVPIILVLFLGFLTTFAMLARGRMGFEAVSWILVEVFFGASQIGFESSVKISPHFGYPLMLIFVCLTNIVLLTSLVSLVSNSLTEVMAHARTEYLFQYSIYVLESSSSRRLTYFMPPLNLIPLLLLRPLRLVLPSEQVRRIRIILLKATHVGFIALIWAYEASIRLVTRGSERSTNPTRIGLTTPRPLSAGLQIDRERYAQRPWLNSALTKATATRAPNDSASVVAETDVAKLVEKLSTQVEELTAIIARMQGS